MVILGVSMDTVYSNTLFSLYFSTYRQGRLEEHGVTTTAMAKELPRLKMLESFL